MAYVLLTAPHAIYCDAIEYKELGVSKKQSPKVASIYDRFQDLASRGEPERSKTSSSISRIKFVETKLPDMDGVGQLLAECAAVNQWANFGPLYYRLANEYAEHMDLGPNQTLTPCANAGVGLEMLARAQAADMGKKKLRWVGSAFSFKNLGRGYFADMHFLDCDAEGMLDLLALQAMPQDSYDGIIVTNPFGLCTKFAPYIHFAKATGKKLIIDNAAGMGRDVAHWPWQVFSLHHTKPYGVGEGGLVLSPTDTADFMKLLINYDAVPRDPAYWLNNGKISDISCAFLIDRLRRIDDWEAGYLEQRDRVVKIFAGFGLTPLLPVDGAPPTNSLPVLLGGPVTGPDVLNTRRIDIARQYQPLAPVPQTQAIFNEIINFPTHPGLGSVSDAEITDEVATLLTHVS